MDQPTKEQIQWFWRQCGFEDIAYLDTSDRVCAHHYVSPDKSWGKAWYPPIDLNNLFKYAVPKLQDKGGFCRYEFIIIKGGYRVFIMPGQKMDSYLYYWSDIYEDPALALFWAIYKVLGGKE